MLLKRLLLFVSLMVLILGTVGLSFLSGLEIGKQKPLAVVTRYIDRPVIQTVVVTKEVIVEVPVDRIVKIYPPLRQFVSGANFEAEMRYYSSGITILGGNCIDTALAFVETARERGYLVSTEVILGSTHMVVSTLIFNGEFWLYDPEAKRCWLEWTKK